MDLTLAQQKYFAYWLIRSLPSDSLGWFAASIKNVQILNSYFNEMISSNPLIKNMDKCCIEIRWIINQAQNEVDERKENPSRQSRGHARAED